MGAGKSKLLRRLRRGKRRQKENGPTSDRPDERRRSSSATVLQGAAANEMEGAKFGEANNHFASGDLALLLPQETPNAGTRGTASQAGTAVGEGREEEGDVKYPEKVNVGQYHVIQEESMVLNGVASGKAPVRETGEEEQRQIRPATPPAPLIPPRSSGTETSTMSRLRSSSFDDAEQHYHNMESSSFALDGMNSHTENRSAQNYRTTGVGTDPRGESHADLDSLSSTKSKDILDAAVRSSGHLEAYDHFEAYSDVRSLAGGGAAAAAALNADTGMVTVIGDGAGGHRITRTVMDLATTAPPIRRNSSQGSSSGYPGHSIRSTYADPLVPVPAAVARLSGHSHSGHGSKVLPGNAARSRRFSSHSTSFLHQRRQLYRRRVSEPSINPLNQSLISLDDSDSERSASPTGVEDNKLVTMSKRGSIDSQVSLTHEILVRYRDVERARAQRPYGSACAAGRGNKRLRNVSKKAGISGNIFDDPATVMGYASVPLLEIDRLPRGGLSFETKAVGRIQFGIPPETIKDSMRLGFEVPRVYIVPVERFCREMGPALGINLAEFEFPAYFNFFVRQKKCTLVVDSEEAEANIRRVFGETLLGPAQFRDHDLPKKNEEEDFDPGFPAAARPNFYNESLYFRTQEKSEIYDELCLDMLVEFCHYTPRDSPLAIHEKLGVSPSIAISDKLKSHLKNDGPNSSSKVDLGEPSLASQNFIDRTHSSRSLLTNDTTVNHKHNPSSKDRKRHHTWLDDNKNDQWHLPNEAEPKHKVKLVPEFQLSGSHGSEDRRSCDRFLGVEYGSGDLKGKNKDFSTSSLGGQTKSPLTDGIDVQRLQRAVSNPELTRHNVRGLKSDGILKEADTKVKLIRRRSMDSADRSSALDKGDGMSWTTAGGESFFPDSKEDGKQHNNSWMYSQAKWLGELILVESCQAVFNWKTSDFIELAIPFVLDTDLFI